MNLVLCMNPDISVKNPGTTTQQGYEGIPKYCQKYSRPMPVGSSRKPYFDWNWIVEQVNNGNPMCMNALPGGYPEISEPHSFFAVGYQRTSTGNFIRVSDSSDDSFSHFYDAGRYSDNIKNVWYYRWA